MKKESKELIKWKCLLCEHITVSNSFKRHQIDYCKCGKTFVDAEEFYTRHSDNVEFLEELK